jgi:hypothetical protein
MVEESPMKVTIRGKKNKAGHSKEIFGRCLIDEPSLGHPFSVYFSAWCSRRRMLMVTVGCERLLVWRLHKVL